MEQPRVAVGERVACWLKIRGWSVPHMAALCGWNRQKAWRIVAGKVDVSTGDLEQIVGVLGVTMAEFWGGQDGPAVQR